MAAAAAPAAEGAKRWFPLESNPDVMNDYIRKLGFPAESGFAFVDVLSTEEWGLGMVPKPVVAVVMLFPICDASEKHRASEQAAIDAGGQTVAPGLYYTKQTVGNACGTVGLIHAVANSGVENIGGWFKQFLDATRGLDSADARAAALEGSQELDDAHGETAQQGQSAVPDAEDRINTHFVTFAASGGHLYELDGRKANPINHGATTPETMLEDASKVVRAFMARDPEELRFTILALAQVGFDGEAEAEAGGKGGGGGGGEGD